ncbi:MAG: cytochrome c-type biogenesis protein CcmH [Bryobacteraceae bacterium]|nr:cytochrome c-type biogenesis protein CcmH [Bryobacteraceae bacterium]
MKTSFTTIALLFLLAGLSIPQTSTTTYVTPEIRRVGDKLACKCGSCNNTVATCQMLQCHYSSPAREKIAAALKAGSDDQSIVDGFVKEVGLAALAAPPASGFSLLSYLMPFAAILLGLAAILVYWKRFRKPASAPAPAEISDRYRREIEAEMAERE